MSVLSRQRAAEAEAEAADTHGRMPPLARPVVLVRAAVPLAKTAGTAARDGARSAATWAAPRIDGARAWTAPRIERSGLAIRDTIAPMVCEKLIAAARRVDVAAPRLDATPPRRRWPRVVAGTALVAAAAGAAAAAAAGVLRRRKDDGTRGAPGEAAEAGAGTQTAQDGPLPDADGSGADDNSSGPSSAT
jgi:hypothetical protein